MNKSLVTIVQGEMERREISAVVLAEMTDGAVSHSTISRWLRQANHLRGDKLEAILNALDLVVTRRV